MNNKLNIDARIQEADIVCSLLKFEDQIGWVVSGRWMTGEQLKLDQTGNQMEDKLEKVYKKNCE